jgi:hypothetical protein
LKKLAMMLVTSLLCLAGIEVGLRVFLPPRFHQIFDERSLSKPNPNSDWTYVLEEDNGGYRIPVHINSVGLRGAEIPIHKTADMRRIMVYGDSFIEAEFTPQENTFAKQLELLMSAATKKSIETINAGVSGYGPDQISLRMDAELDRFKPDLIIIAIYSGNDFGDLIRNKLYKLDAAGALVPNEHYLSASMKSQLILPRWRTLWATRRLLSYVSGENSTNPKPRDRATYMETALAECLNEYADYKQSGEVKNLFVDHYDADVSLTPESESARYKTALMNQVMIRIQRSADEKKVPLVFMFIPAVVDICAEFGGKVDASRFPAYQPATLTDALENMARTNRPRYLNLFAGFKEDPCRLFFKYPNGHWNDAGQRLAAQAMSQFILSSLWTDKAAR